MGVVYQARQTKLGRLVALKLILAGGHAGADDLARFRTEAEAIARLQHPNIVQVFEVSEYEGRPFFSLEFCPGGSLAKRLDGKPLSGPEAARLVETLARAVQVAHEAKVVHRDLKPANVLLTADGTPKVTDFGLAKMLDEAGGTVTGEVLGTPSYMAPEQAGGKKGVGPAADVYALGAILYELLTTRPPFQAATPLDTLMQVVADEPVPPRRLNAQVPADLETICLKCLHKDPHRRYESAAHLAEDLRRFQAGEPIAARPVGNAERLWRWCRRKPFLASGAAAIGLALAGVVVLAVLAARNARAVAAAEKENARKDQQRLQESLLEQARAERLLRNRHRALELLAEAARTGSREGLRQEAIQAITSSGVRFVREVAPDWAQWGKNHRDVFLKQLREYAFPEFGPDPFVRLHRGTDGGAEFVYQDDKLVALPPRLGLPKKCWLSGDRHWLVFRDVTEPDLIRVWDCRRRLLHGRLPACGDLAMAGNGFGLLSGIAFSPDGVLLASTRARAGEYVLHPSEIDSTRTLITRDGLLASRWSRDGKFLLTCSRTSIVGAGSSPGRTFQETGGGGDPVKLEAGFAQVWEVSCPVPTYQVREPVERLRFRPDGRQVAVNDTVWDVQPGNTRSALRQTALAAPGCLLGFRGAEVWGLFPAVSGPSRGELPSAPVTRRHNRWCGELSAALAVRPSASVIGPGPLAGIGNLIANLGPTRWERPRVVRVLPTTQEVILAPPPDQRWRSIFVRKGLGIGYAEPYRLAWSRDGAKLLALVSVGWHEWRPNPTLPDASIGGSATTPTDRFVEAWDIPSGKRYPLALPKAEWKAIAWHPEGRRFAAASSQAVQVWDLATGAEIATLSREDFDHLVWGNDGRYLLAVQHDKQAAVYTPEGVEARTWSAPRKDWAAFSPWGEGRGVVAGGEDGLVRILDVETGQEVARWKAHEAAVTALTLSPDGALLVSGGRDRAVRVWNLPWIRAELAKLGLDW
jgi:hypothetical protein